MNLLQPWVTEETSEVLILVVLVGVVAEEVESKLQLRVGAVGHREGISDHLPQSKGFNS